MRKIIDWIPTGSLLLSLTTFGSYAVGLIRDRILAQTFGAGRELDAYTAAFLLPDFLFNFFIASGIAAAVVPIVTDLLKKKHADEQIYINSLLSAAVGAMAVISLFLIIFAHQISVLVVPGFTPEDQAVVAHLLRILCLSPLFFSISNTLGSYLIVKRRYFFYGLSPILYNLGIIFGTLVFAPSLGITGVAYGALVGALLHLLVRLYDSLKNGFRFRKAFAFRAPEFLHTLRLMLPKMFGHPVELATFWAFTVFASSLAPGSVAIIGFARNFQSVPVSIIGITLATTTFPLLAAALAEKRFAEFSQTLKRSSWLIFSGSLLAALFIFLVREPLISLVFQGGAFSQENVRVTALTLGFFTLSIPTEALSHLFARAFYSAKNTLIPVIIGILSFILTIAFVYFFLAQLGIIAIPLGFFLGSAFKLIALWICLPFHIKKISVQN